MGTGPGRDAVTLHCSSCGAPFAAASTVCSHCRAEITIEERGLDCLCDACGARMSSRARFCMRCGKAAAPQPVVPRPELAPCPRCKGALRERAIEGAAALGELVECANCGGLWLAPEALDRLCASHEAAARATDHLIRRPPPLLRLDTAKVTYLPCARCRDLMVRRNFGGASGVIVDVCARHGVWLDHSELEKVVDFARSGGLLRSREREVERLQREAREARDRRVDAAAAATFDARGRELAYGLGDLFGDLLLLFRWRR